MLMNTIRTLFPLLISTSATVALTFAASDLVGSSGSAPWEPFFSVFGMIYAIISGFLLVSVLGRYGDLSNTCEAELNAIEDLRDFLVYVDGDQDSLKWEVRMALRDYVASVSKKEWKAMSKGKKIDSDTSEELYAVMRAVNKLKITNESDRVALRSLIEKLSDLTTLRTRRISLSNQTLPPRLKLLISFMSLVLISALIAVGAKDLMIHMAMVGAITISAHLLYMIVMDLDQPFTGVWKIEKAQFEALQVHLEDKEHHSING